MGWDSGRGYRVAAAAVPSEFSAGAGMTAVRFGKVVVSFDVERRERELELDDDVIFSGERMVM
jgi:hypothetical protein